MSYPDPDVAAAVLRELARICVPPRAPEEVRLTDCLERDLNVDSLGFIELVIELENAFGVQFEDDHVFVAAYPDVQSLVDYVAGTAPRAAAPA